MIFWRKSLLNALVQIFMMLRHLVAEISRFKFDDYCVICTGASDLKLLLGGVYGLCKIGCHSNKEAGDYGLMTTARWKTE